MTKVKLIEVFKQHLNLCEVIATITTRPGMNILGIAEFYINQGEIVPTDEDELCDFIEEKNLSWDLYIPTYVDV